MKMMRRKILLGCFLLLFSLVCDKKVLAADAVALKVAPLFFDLQINPGEEKTGQIYVENNSANDTDVSVSFSDFFIDDAGNYIFSDGKDVSNPELKPYDMQGWFSTDSPEFHLAKGESRLVKYTIDVPKDTDLGGHYGAIFFKTDCQAVTDKNVVYSDKSSLCVSGRVGTLFLATIGGNASRKAQIEQVNVPRFTLSDKANLSVDIRNTGNTHFMPSGSIDVKSLTGNEVLHLDVKDKTLLPNENYAISGEILRSDGIGVYRIIGSIKDGDGNVVNFQRWIIMFPWKEIIAIILLIGLVYWFRRRFEVKKIA